MIELFTVKDLINKLSQMDPDTIVVTEKVLESTDTYVSYNPEWIRDNLITDYLGDIREGKKPSWYNGYFEEPQKIEKLEKDLSDYEEYYKKITSDSHDEDIDDLDRDEWNINTTKKNIEELKNQIERYKKIPFKVLVI